jgi:4-aminobutyrate aminotransferase-like enzyme/Ser/Thr protein kinase RdoA (MazF antagonist)
VLKVSNEKEDARALDAEAAAALHAVAHDPTLPVALPYLCVTPNTSESRCAGPAHRAQWHHGTSTHWVRCYPVMPGTTTEFEDGPLSDELLRAWGETAAKLCRSLRSLALPSALRPTLWDVHNAASLRPLLDWVPADNGLRALCADVLERFETYVVPMLALLRHQVVHGDFNMGNVLTSNGRISGIVDFGDMSFTSLAADFSAVLTSLGRAHMHGGSAELLRMARIVIDGYQKETPFEDAELAVLGDLWMVRVCAEVVLTEWRVSAGLEDPERSRSERPVFEAQLRALYALGPAGRASGLLGGTASIISNECGNELVSRRNAAIGPGSEPLSYGEEHVQFSHASGCRVVDVSGRTLLDCYNNVPCVGHAHPRVALAIARQARLANINMRYLHPFAVSLAERLKATLPPTLDTVFFVNSGSEANDLAWRMATAYTGHRGALCSAYAYHGITEVAAALSPETGSVVGFHPPWVERFMPPDSYRGLYEDTCEFEAALARLSSKGLKPAMAILDGVMQSDGVLVLEPAFVQALVKLTHTAGALWCADEVQGGHGRSGSHMWSFERFGIVPDFVTMGKPMGNGHPVAAVVTRREIADAFVARTGLFFSTFGGNPVSCAAAHAVLDVLADERVLERTATAGDALRSQVAAATARFDCVGAVRGIGLANGVELVTDRSSKAPDRRRASWVKTRMRQHGVLIGVSGPNENVLKVRPPLAFTAADVPSFVTALVAALDEPLPPDSDFNNLTLPPGGGRCLN